MDDETLKSVLDAEVTSAVSFIDSDIGPLRAKAMEYYRGDLFGNEEEGRSQVVSRDVADTVNAVLPSLMRVFFGPEHVVEFVPQCEEDEALAEQQTDYINYIITRDNEGFEVFYAAIKNALREKVGFVKYWWDDSVEVTTRRYTGLDMDGLTKLLEDIQQAYSHEITEKEQTEDGLSITLTLKRPRDRVAIAAVPPEEFLICRDAVSLDTARFVGHRRDLTVSELVAMGYDREMVEAQAGDDDDMEFSQERMSRNPWSRTREGPSGDPSTRLVRYVEGYLLVDYDDDGIAELRKVCRVGSEVVHNEMIDERPFAAFHCDPEPHTFFGESLADKVMDVQKWKSSVVRAGQDSLAGSIFPRVVVGMDGGVVMDDVQNNETGAIIRARDVSQVKPLVVPDVSESALGWLGYIDEVRENRTGMSKVSQGLDAEALQNTTAAAAEGQFTRSQERIELIACIMASGMRRLFKGVSGLVAANQRKARVVKLRNQWVQIDPREWRTDMDVAPNVGLGGGSNQQKAQILGLILTKQESILQMYGLQNPLVSPKQYLDTLGKFIELGGFKNPSSFFTDPGQVDKALAQLAQQPPKPDPKAMEVQGRLQLQAQQAQAGMQMDAARHAHEQDKAAAQLQLQQMQLAAEQQTKREQIQAEIALKREQIAMEIQLKREELQAEIALKERQAAHAASLAEQSAKLSNVEVGGDPG